MCANAQELADELDVVLNSEVGRQTFHKLADGQGAKRVQGKARWVVRTPLSENHVIGGPTMKWAQLRDLTGQEDRNPDKNLRILLDNDCDVSVQVFDGRRFVSVEFCDPSGGDSSRTRLALIEGTRAIEADTAAWPDHAHSKSP
jgi:hypothetical protein